MIAIAPHSLIAASIPQVVAKTRDNTKRIHYALGLGDGSMQQAITSQQGLRGMHIRGRDDTDKHEEDTKRFNLMPVVTDDADLKEFLRRGADRRAAAMTHRQEGGGGSSTELHQSTTAGTPFGPASDDSWQISFIMMLGIFAILVGLFLHFSTDPGHTTTYLRRRTKKKPNFASPSSYRKKTDEWSEDEEVTEDDSYRADNEGASGGSSITKKRANASPQPPDDPAARLYYNLNTGDTNFREQEHRLRRSANHQSSAVDPYQATPTRASSTASTMSSRGGSAPAGGVNKMDRSPRGSITSRASTMQTSNHAAATVPTPKPSPPPIPFDSSGLGSGLEGFEPSAASPDGSNHDFEAWDENNKTVAPSTSPSNEPAVLRRHLVKPMGPFTPTESFSSMDVVAAHAARIKEEAAANLANPQSQDKTTPPITSEEEYSYSSPNKLHNENALTSPIRSQSIPFSSPLRSYPVPFGGEFAELSTPRVDHTSAKKRELAKMLMAKGNDLPAPPILIDHGDQNNSNQNDFHPTITTSDASPNIASSHALPDLPLVPRLDHSAGDSPRSGHTGDAPRSVLLEELQLVRMESGVSGPKWRTNVEADDTSPFESGGQSFQHPMFGHEKSAWYEAPDAATAEMRRQESENLEKLKQASESIDPADDPRNSIQHIRTDLTFSSDSSSSLSSKITFSELKLEDVIGGGGFGQVWKAKWKGTPVAVKVLTGTAQAEKIPKAVLEEFIGEINMVSGMRHPNICLFMGACLDAPNRAIITELCENGSLWDALRLPLAPPYRVADGVTRNAWPLELYEQIHSPPTTSGERERPIAPKGVWPWYLVKRVASGSARGMCYLHSGCPPVLHRDLKSANILLDESYTAKLADFGLSRLKAVRSGMTGNCGTVQWMAPEVLCSEDYAEPADVYSFGIILWEMLTQECPYEGMTPIQCALAVLNQNYRPEIPAWCPQPFRALIKNCVERDPKARPTFPQILQALDALP
mmetsp:Transcript_21928/g.43922  ORF Transcript_21928/g.43922 Transcript_21928/m.43922 type:complete len:984 (-) Transcript_21928:52-3003(-)